MKNIALLFSFFFSFNILVSQTTSADYSVPLTATTNLLVPNITLHWPHSDSATSYKVYRKQKVALTWGTALATLTAADTFYIDVNVSIDTAYEYKVEKTAYGTTVAGYIYAAIRQPAQHDKGILLLMVDSLFEDSLQTEVHRLMKDISGDGWEVKKFVFSRNDSVPGVAAQISSAYWSDTERTRAALLLGHIPVPYSGDINPDGHGDHKGAWPADSYYADVNGVWTDYIVNDTSAASLLNRNIPDDGKFDNSTIQSNLELQISRIDFYNMPSIPRSEVQLMKNYLDKNHAYRQKLLVPQHRAIVDDNFGVFGGEAFASCGIRNFSPLVGNANVYNFDFISTLDTASYQWAYGCGGGWYSGAGGIGSTTDFANDSVRAIFTMLFGSYFGDWNTQDNFLRAPLCANEPALTCCWAGRPYWFFHHMALGENIGYSARLSQNNSFTYWANYALRFVHVALMGDLTLKEDAVEPPSALVITANTSSPFGASLSWNASGDSVVGYYVYRSTSEFGRYFLISNLIAGNNFTDSAGNDGLKYYMVRACKLQSSPSGNYFNLSEGITDSATVTYAHVTEISETNSSNQLLLYPNPASEKIFILNDALRAGDKLEVLNTAGEKLKEKTIAADSDLTVDVSGLENGIYFLRIKNNSQLLSKTFVIMR